MASFNRLKLLPRCEFRLTLQSPLHSSHPRCSVAARRDSHPRHNVWRVGRQRQDRPKRQRCDPTQPVLLCQERQSMAQSSVRFWWLNLANARISIRIPAAVGFCTEHQRSPQSKLPRRSLLRPGHKSKVLRERFSWGTLQALLPGRRLTPRYDSL